MLTKGTLRGTPHSVKPSLKYISLILEVDPAHLHKRLFSDAEPSVFSLFAGCGLHGSSHGPPAPLLLVQSEFPGKVSIWEWSQSKDSIPTHGQNKNLTGPYPISKVHP